jgi:hypothetical protein
MWWEDQARIAAHHGVPLTSCSRRGARIEHTVEQRLSEWSSRHVAARAPDVRARLDAAVAAAPVLAAPAIETALRAELLAGKRLASESQRAAAALSSAIEIQRQIAMGEIAADGILGGTAVAPVAEISRYPRGDQLEVMLAGFQRTHRIWSTLTDQIRSAIVEIRSGHGYAG